MIAKIAAALLLSSALLAPSVTAADDLPPLDELFSNRGECESTLKQARNIARAIVRERRDGQTSALVNRLANPAVKFVCTALTRDGETVFTIVEG
jgi:hypothetical protein